MSTPAEPHLEYPEERPPSSPPKHLLLIAECYAALRAWIVISLIVGTSTLLGIIGIMVFWIAFLMPLVYFGSHPIR